MKFGKSLSIQIEETLPEWRDKFLSYKELKKRLKLFESPNGFPEKSSKRQKLDGGESAETSGDKMTDEEIGFINLLEDELEKFNAFFVEKEEEYIIRLKELRDRIETANEVGEETIIIRREIVDFHGEMVLLENYSALNYTGLVKILKKYDKRTGALIRLPFIQKVLQQPFFTTDLLYKLVKECERMLDGMMPSMIPSGAVEDDDFSEKKEVQRKVPNDLSEIENMESLYMKSTISALRVLKEIRSGSSTVSVFSLPPLQVPVIEQVAK